MTILNEMMSGLLDFSWAAGSPLVFAGRLLEEFGPVVALLGVVGAAASIPCREPASRFVLLLFASFAFVTLRFGYWLPRYVLVLLVIGAAFAGAAVEVAARLPPRALPPRARLAVIFLAVGLTAVASIGMCQVGCLPAGPRLLPGRRTAKRSEGAGELRLSGRCHLLNQMMSDDDRVAIGVNLQPFLYLRRPYLHVHPITEKGNLQAVRSSAELKRAFEQQRVTFVAVRRWRRRAKSRGRARHRCTAFSIATTVSCASSPETATWRPWRKWERSASTACESTRCRERRSVTRG